VVGSASLRLFSSNVLVLGKGARNEQQTLESLVPEGLELEKPSQGLPLRSCAREAADRLMTRKWSPQANDRSLPRL
jgi:hypothetical protein